MLESRRWQQGLIAALLLTTVACNGDASKSLATAPPLSLELVGQIRCTGCDDAGRITPAAMAILDSGSIAVLDHYEPFVRVFGPTGELQRAFGGKGQGPGDIGLSSPGRYLTASTLFGNESGGVTVIDIMPVVLEAFDEEGNFLHQTTVGLRFAIPIAETFDPRTRTYFRLSFEPGGPGHISRCEFVGIGSAACDGFTDPGLFLGEGPLGGALQSLALGSTPDGHLVIANTASYRIWILNDDAETVVSSGRDLPPLMKTEREIRREKEALERIGRVGSEINPYRPYIFRHSLQVDGAGRIWVLVTRGTEGSSIFDVFAPGGAYLEEVVVEAPLGYSESSRYSFVINGDTLAAIVNEPDGNDEIWVFRIVES